MNLMGWFGKAKSKRKKKSKGPAAAGPSWPAGTRIGIYGHANCGKSVFLTVLNEESKVSRDIQLSVTDNRTSNELLKNYRAIWGLGTAQGAGTMVDLRGERAFPEPTQPLVPYVLNAILDRKEKETVVTLDYPGSAVDISSTHQERETVRDFMASSDGLLFFYDPKVLGAELVSQAHVSSFVTMLEQLAPLSKRVPVPVALVITKADTLDGFTGDAQSVLIRETHEHIFSEDFETFLDFVLSDNQIQANTAWAATVRTVLLRLKDFLHVVLGRTLDFQIFFVSSTGNQPMKIGEEVGRSLYQPPDRMAPVGIRAPWYWLLKAVVRNRSIARWRRATKWVAAASLIFALVYSLPFAYHFGWLLPRATNVEASVKETFGGNMFNLPADQRAKVRSAYRRYAGSFPVEALFPSYQKTAEQIELRYRQASLDEALAQLDQVIERFIGIVIDTSIWPKPVPGDTLLAEGASTVAFTKVSDDIAMLRELAPDTSQLARRADRMRWYYDRFRQTLFSPGDTAIWQQMKDQVAQENQLRTDDLSRSEKNLGEAILAQQVKKSRRVIAQQTSVDIQPIFDEINSITDPEYRLTTAVTRLREARGRLAADPNNPAIGKIDRYIQDAKYFDRSRDYEFKVGSIPAGHHLHLMIAGRGRDGTWRRGQQIRPGFTYTFKWKAGDEIHLALDPDTGEETWGERSEMTAVLRDKYALFDLTRAVSFSPTHSVTITLENDPTERLPRIQ